jgi:hypothetical protein
MLVSIAIDTIAHSYIRLVVDEWAGDEQRLEQLERTVIESGRPFDPIQALRGEFYTSLATFRNFALLGGLRGLGEWLDGETPVIDRSKVRRDGKVQGLFARASMTTTASAWNQVFRSMESEPKPYRGFGAHLDKQMEMYESRFRASEIMPQIMTPLFSRANDALLNADVQQDLAVALVRCMKFRAKHNRWPTDWAEVGASAQDPFAPGSPIRTRFEADAVCIWSVGPDRVDDGGKRKKSGSDRFDTAFNWPPQFSPPPSLK